MSYKYSKGAQVIGDLKAQDDTQRDTQIDFEEDYIGFETSGSAVMVVSGSKVGIGTTTPDYELDVAGDIGVDHYIYHNGDGNTLINFSDDKIILKAGGKAMVTMEEKGSAPHEITINDGSNNIDFVVKGNGSNAGNPGMKFDASNNRLGINGVGTPSYELDVAGDIGLSEYIYHKGDDDTFIRFQDDNIIVKAGNINFIELTEDDSQDKLIINEGRTDLDFIVRSPGENLALYLNAGNEVFHINHGEEDFKTKIHSDHGEAITVNSAGVILNEDGHATNDFRVESDGDTHALFVDSGNNLIGIGTSSPISKLDVAGKIAITSEVSTPSAPADGKGWLYTKTDGKIYWQSSDVSETDLTAGGGGGSTDPGGSDEQVQFNDDGDFGGDSGLLFNKTTNILTVEKVAFADVSGISNDTASGEIVKFGSGTLTAGKLYYLHTDGAWTLADADSTSAGSTQLLGIALGSSPTSNGLLVKGMFDMHSYFSGSFTTGQPVYLSTDAGKISTTEITTEGKVRRLVGYCTNASNVIYFNPESTYSDNVSVPYPKYYFDGSSANTQIGDNSLSNATITADNGKYENGFIDFGSSGNTHPALFGNDIDLAGGVYTFSFWFYSKRTGSDWGSVLRRQSGGSPANTTDYPILIRDTDDELGVGYEPGTNPLEFYSSGYDMTSLEGSTTWVHMAVVADGSQSKFYINGATAGSAVDKVITTSVKELGSYDGNDTQTFAEGIDEFAFWAIALSADQIAKIYNSTTKLINLVT